VFKLTRIIEVYRTLENIKIIPDYSSLDTVSLFLLYLDYGGICKTKVYIVTIKLVAIILIKKVLFYGCPTK